MEIIEGMCAAVGPNMYESLIRSLREIRESKSNSDFDKVLKRGILRYECILTRYAANNEKLATDCQQLGDASFVRFNKKLGKNDVNMYKDLYMLKNTKVYDAKRCGSVDPSSSTFATLVDHPDKDKIACMEQYIKNQLKSMKNIPIELRIECESEYYASKEMQRDRRKFIQDLGKFVRVMVKLHEVLNRIISNVENLLENVGSVQIGSGNRYENLGEAIGENVGWITCDDPWYTIAGMLCRALWKGIGGSVGAIVDGVKSLSNRRQTTTNTSASTHQNQTPMVQQTNRQEVTLMGPQNNTPRAIQAPKHTNTYVPVRQQPVRTAQNTSYPPGLYYDRNGKMFYWDGGSSRNTFTIIGADNTQFTVEISNDNNLSVFDGVTNLLVRQYEGMWHVLKRDNTWHPLTLENISRFNVYGSDGTYTIHILQNQTHKLWVINHKGEYVPVKSKAGENSFVVEIKGIDYSISKEIIDNYYNNYNYYTGQGKKKTKLHTGPKGGKYVIKNGKKVYCKKPHK